MPLWVLPLRVPQPCDDLVDQLTQWLDEDDEDEHSVAVNNNSEGNSDNTKESERTTAAAAAAAVLPRSLPRGQLQSVPFTETESLASDECNPRPDFSSAECHVDLLYLAACRTQLESVLSRRCRVDTMASDEETRGDTENGDENEMNETFLVNTCLPLLQEYAAALHECCSRGFPVTDLQGKGLTLTWKCNGSNLTALRQSPNDENNTVLETHHSLAWERVNVIINIAVVFVLQASTQQLDSRTGWTRAGLLLQQAATVIQYIRERVLCVTGEFHASPTLSHNFLHVWESYLLAEAQRAAYQNFRMQPRPKHFMLAKLAAAAVPLFSTVEHLCNAAIDSSRPSSSSSLSSTHPSVDCLLNWEESARAWGMWMTALAEHHQSMVHREKNEWGLELSRLEGALKFGNFCQEFCESSELLVELAQNVVPVLKEIDQRLENAEKENNEKYHEPVLEHDELPEVTPQLSVKTDLENVSKLLPSVSKPFFTGVLDPSLRRYADRFRSEIQKVVTQTEWLAEEKTEAGRNALAAVNLPHALTAYRQGQNGGGILDSLWERIDSVQRERKIDRVLDEMWKVRSFADSARSTYKQIENHLKDDLEVDILFRHKYPNFEGHDVTDIQKPFRQALQNYQHLMGSANDSDDLLIRRCEILESDPKFRLLKLQKSQLDRLLPPGLAPDETDVSMLSSFLVDLSTLFNERDSLRHDIKERAKTYNISEDLISLGKQATTSDYRKVLEAAKASFHGVVEEMRLNLERQTPLLSKILWENEQFMRARDQSQADNEDSPLVKIEDALDEIDEVSKHLKEGKAFYDVIIPKLEKLYQQVEDLSMRLSLERSDYEVYVNRPRHEPPPPPPAPPPPSNQRFGPTGGLGSSRYHGTSSNSNGTYEGGRLSRPSDLHDHNTRTPILSTTNNSSGGNLTNNRLSSRSLRSTGSGDTPNRVDDEKVASLVAMDFDPDKVVAALKRHGNDLELALNDLLSF